MTNLQQWLQDLTVSELAALEHYKGKTYLPKGRTLLIAELEQRKLDSVAIKVVVKGLRFNKANTGCPRCNSLKQLPNGDCTICGWSEAEEAERIKPWYIKLLEVLSIFGH